MYICRIVIRNFRNFKELDVKIGPGVTCILGENNSGKTNLIHAIRLALDANLSSYYRQLAQDDFNSTSDMSSPQQIIVSLEFTEYLEHENECALVGQWEVETNRARLHYRYRPKRIVREEIEAGERLTSQLRLDDYHWEITGGGEIDPAEVEWTQELGSSVRFADLQQFQVVSLPALRDVQQDLRQSRISPLGRILSATDIPEAEKEQLVGILSEANQRIDQTPTIQSAGQAIQTSFNETAGTAHAMRIRLGMADPSFASIARSLTVLMSNAALTDFDPSRNGLGLNNILYISMLLEHFRRRVATQNTAGQLLLFEEPEAHLHPQLQRVLYDSLNTSFFQTFLTTHSTHISSRASIDSVIALTSAGTAACDARSLVRDAGLTSSETADINRYLDATRSTLLFARKVILVEGPSELFLLPPIIKRVLDKDLDRLGISIIPIYGIHFDVYAKLFSSQALPKKCAIITDGDLDPGLDMHEDISHDPSNLDRLNSDYVRVFRCKTTFERAFVKKGTLRLLAAAVTECGAPQVADRLRTAFERLTSGSIPQDEQVLILSELRVAVLSAAERFGKVRFSQIASKHASLAEDIPEYIRNAVTWLVS